MFNFFSRIYSSLLKFKVYSLHSVHYPAYSLNVASMYLKLGRLYLGLEKKTQGVKALKKVNIQILQNTSYRYLVVLDELNSEDSSHA